MWEMFFAYFTFQQTWTICALYMNFAFYILAINTNNYEKNHNLEPVYCVGVPNASESSLNMNTKNTEIASFFGKI